MKWSSVFDNGATLFAVKNEAGAEPASITWMLGVDGGEFPVGLPAD